MLSKHSSKIISSIKNLILMTIGGFSVFTVNKILFISYLNIITFPIMFLIISSILYFIYYIFIEKFINEVINNIIEELDECF